MKRIILSIFLLLLICGNALAVTSTFTDTGDHLWETAANWSAGVPDATVDAVISAGTTALHLGSTARACKTFTATGTSGLTITGSAAFSVSGNFTIDSNVTWNTTGNLYMVAAGTFTTGNATITCAEWGDNWQAGDKTLTVGSSTINCTNISWGGAAMTITANTATINIVPVTNAAAYFGGKVWGGTVKITLGSSTTSYIMSLQDSAANTFGNLSVTFNLNTNGQASSSLYLYHSPTISGTFTVVGSDTMIRPMISGYVGWSAAGIATITAATVDITKAIDFRSITGAGAGSWDLSAIPSGNLGGNSGITFRTATTYYLAQADGRQNYNNVYSVANDGTADGTSVFPLTQDTLIINDNSFAGTGQTFHFHSGTYNGTIDASGLTKAENLGLPRYAFGDLIYTSPAITIATGINKTVIIDARLKDESSAALSLNISRDTGLSEFTVSSLGGTVKLAKNLLNAGGTFTLATGTLDLHHYTISGGTFTNSGGTVINTPRGGFFF